MISDRTIITGIRCIFVVWLVGVIACCIWLAVWLLERLR